MKIKRRKTRQVNIGNVKIGGRAPISIQSMTKTPTLDVAKTVKQINELQAAGCEIIRIALKDEKSAHALRDIKKKIKLPLVADIHFNYKLALIAIESGADAIRLNPGNIKNSTQIKEILKQAKKKKIPIRIGVNSGSLNTPESMGKGVLKYLKIFEQNKFRDIIISLKSSSVIDTIEANKKIARLVDYPIHLGITAAGLPQEGMIKSAVGIGSLLLDGIGDTIRVSLTGEPRDEVTAAKSILQSLGLRKFGPKVISCPTCGRCQVDLAGIVKELERKLSTKKPVTIAVMGCEVNGPGEARVADIGIAAGRGRGVLFKKGKIIKRIEEKDFVDEVVKSVHTHT